MRRVERERPNHPFLIWAPFDGEAKTWTYRQFAADAARLAGGLAARGIGPGDRVLVHFENCPEALLVRFALARLGAVCVATNAMAAGPEIAHYAEASRATAAITQASFAELVSSHARHVRWVVAAERESADARYGADSLAALFAEPAPAYPAHHSDTAAIMFTTGTTGKPKGVVWTHSNVLWGCRYSAQVYGHRAEDVSLISLPLFHVVGLCWSFLPVLWAGGTAVLQPRFSASRFWPASIEHRATLASHVLFTSMALQSQTVPERHFYRQWTVARGDRQVAVVQPNSGLRAVVGHDRTRCAGHLRRSEFRAGRRCAGQALAGASGPHPRPGGKAGQARRDRRTDDQGRSRAVDLSRNTTAIRRPPRPRSTPTVSSAPATASRCWMRAGSNSAIVRAMSSRWAARASPRPRSKASCAACQGVRDVAVVGAQDDAYGQVPVAFVEAEVEPGRDLEGDILASCRVVARKVQSAPARGDPFRAAARRKCEDRQGQAASDALIRSGSHQGATKNATNDFRDHGPSP